MTTERRRFGDRGEAIAADFLRRAGFRILARQARMGRLGEIDLVALDPTPPSGLRGAGRGEVVFIEVKTRATGEYGPPEEAVTAAKRRKLARAIEAFRIARGLADAPCRFDVVAVDLSGPAPRVRHLRDVPLE